MAMRYCLALSAVFFLCRASAIACAQTAAWDDAVNAQGASSAELPADTATQTPKKAQTLTPENQLESYQADAAKLFSPAPLASVAQKPQVQPSHPTEFQNFVATTTGQHLNLYGYDLFRNEPAKFVPSNLSAASADYILGPDDELRIHIWGAVNYTGNLRVDRSGNIFLPQIGLIHVAGIRFAELDTHLRQATSRIFHSFDLSADLGRIRSIQIYVTGMAQHPGAYNVSSLSSLVDALFASGGVGPEGSLRHIQLKREGKIVADFDLYALLLQGDKSGDVRLQAEDVLFIPPVGAQAAIYGSIRMPAIYELRAHETIQTLLETAGKTTALSSRTKISLDRAENNQRTAIEFSLDSTGLSETVVDGDILRVFSIVPSYYKTVTLRGSIANAGRYGWREKMRLSDLLPDRDALMSRDYWWKRNHLGLSSPEFEPQVTDQDPLLETLDARISNSSNRASNQTASQQAQSSRHASIAIQDQIQLETDLTTGQLLTKKNTVRIVAPELDWNYAVIERVDPATLKTSLLPFDLGKLVLQHDTSQDLELEAGDTVTIFSQNDIRIPASQQTKYITLEGEIMHAGTYSVLPNETLRDIVHRAGGLTTNAYLYGSEFERESTRILQQQRIDEYVHSLQLSIARSAVAFANHAVLSGQGNLPSSSTSVQAEFLNELKTLRATGRIVLKLSPESSTVDDLPQFALENGDRFIVPAVPATVNVVGAIYNQNAFAYQAGITVDKCLHLAGGTTRSADAKRAYVIRADGTVLNHGSSFEFWQDSFQHARLFPGDTLVVPDKSLTPSVNLKNYLEWSQMFSQLAMGAATLSILK